ncbi:hypothetical protein FOXYS1_15022, partial [Fusarium oxysporum]
IRARKPVDVVRDNQTRWLSTLYMMRRGLLLRPFLEDLVEKVTLEFNKECRNGARCREEIPLCLLEESLLGEKDWEVIELMDKVLLDFEEALRMLEGDAQSRLGSATSFTKWEIHPRWRLRESSAQDPYRRILDPKIATALRGRPRNIAQVVPVRLAIWSSESQPDGMGSSERRHAAGRLFSERGERQEYVLVGGRRNRVFRDKEVNGSCVTATKRFFLQPLFGSTPEGGGAAPGKLMVEKARS